MELKLFAEINTFKLFIIVHFLYSVMGCILLIENDITVLHMHLSFESLRNM